MRCDNREDASGDDEGNVKTAKMTLGGFCLDRDAPRVKARIAELVMTANVALAEAYLFANFHVSRCLSDPGFAASQLPKLDRSFYYRCIIAVTTCNAHDTTLGESFLQSKRAYDLLRPEGYHKADMRPFNQLMAELSIQMATMACNSVWANVEGFVFRYLKAVHPELRRWWKTIVEAVVHKPQIALDKIFLSTCPTALAAIEASNQLRSWMEMPSGHQFNTRAHLCMRLFQKILEVLGTRSAAEADASSSKTPVKAGKKRRRIRLFNILPRKNGFTLCYIPITNRTLRAILNGGPNPIEAGLKGDGRNEDHMPIWKRYFNINAVETRNARFDERILTDGKGVSIQRRMLFDRRGGEAEEEVSAFPPDCSKSECLIAHATPECNVLDVGVDPGMTDIVTWANSDWEFKSYSSVRFSKEAHYQTSHHRTRKWNVDTEALVASIPPSTVTSMPDIEAHIRAYLVALPALLQSRFDKGYRSMRFLRYQGKKRTIEKLCDLIAPRERTVVVGFGNWSNNGSGISRSCSGPIREIRQCLSRRPNVLYKNIDERYTSCTCHGCFARLSNMKACSVRVRTTLDGEVIRTEVRNNKVHKVLHCRNSVGSEPSLARCGATWNRDVNASKNILMLLERWFKGFGRPVPFERPANACNKKSVSAEAIASQRQRTPRVAVSGQTQLLSGRPARVAETQA
jgi:hypothetical protein